RPARADDRKLARIPTRRAAVRAGRTLSLPALCASTDWTRTTRPEYRRRLAAGLLPRGPAAAARIRLQADFDAYVSSRARARGERPGLLLPERRNDRPGLRRSFVHPRAALQRRIRGRRDGYSGNHCRLHRQNE